LHDEALNEVGAHLGAGPWDDDLDDIEGVYLESGGEFLVGELEGEVVAMGAIRRISPDAAEVKRMRVRPGLQGRGYGHAMLDSLHRRAARIGYTTLHLDTTVQQWAARGLYLKNGYREVGRGGVGPFDCIYYERSAVA
jgi:GNAT superfamily N-acetyltransferase